MTDSHIPDSQVRWTVIESEVRYDGQVSRSTVGRTVNAGSPKHFFLLAIRTNYIQYIYNYQFYEPMGCHMLWREGDDYPTMLSRIEVFIVLVDHMARFA